MPLAERLEEERREPGVLPGTLTGILREIADAPGASPPPAGDGGLRPGDSLGRFEIVRELGRGGFGVVYEARDRDLGRTVALKVVRTGDRTALREERLLREAEAAARLSHPNIVTIHDAGRCPQGPYLVLELLRGQTLDDRLDQGPLPVREALRVAVEIARGLAHAHAEGVVHRDLKPANVFLCEDGRVKLLDFGLAHALGRRRLDGGTPAYMAPEQWKGAPEDERTDVFALGVVLHRMLAEELPFPEGNGGKAVLSPRAAPALDVPGVPALGPFVARMLRKDPVDRPRDGAEVLSALGAFQREMDRTPSGPGLPARPHRASRRPLAVALAAAVLVALAAGAGLFLRSPPADGGGSGAVPVAVADFANQTGEAELDGLSGMLITSLGQSRRLSVLTRVRMLDVLHRLGKGNVEVVDEALGRELALSAGVRALLLATIRRFDQLYAIELKALDPVTSEYLFTLKEEGQGKSSVPGMIDRLSEKTRERLRETPEDVRASSKPVAALTTASLEAYQHYFRGERLKEAIRYDGAMEEYRKAIAIDPGFALAHYRIAYLGKFTVLPEGERSAAIEAALRNAQRVPEKERMLIQAWKAVMDGRGAEAHALYERVVEAHPQDKEALFMAGDQWLHEDDPVKALPYFERAVALDPAFEPALMHQADSLAMMGRTEEVTRVATRWVERDPSASAYRALAQARLASGKPEEAVDAARRALAIDGSSYSRGYFAESLLLAGRYAEAEEVFRPFATPSARPLDRLAGYSGLATALAYQGRLREALRLAEQMPDVAEGKEGYRRGLLLELRMAGGPTAWTLAEAKALARSGDEKLVRLAVVSLAMFGEVDSVTAAGAEFPPPLAEAVEAVLSWYRGDRQGALRKLRVMTNGHPDARALALCFLGRVALDGGDPRDAITSAEGFRTAHAGSWRSWAFPQALYHAAVAHERLGERAKARAKLDELLRIWRKADPDLPVLPEARALRARLGES